VLTTALSVCFRNYFVWFTSWAHRHAAAAPMRAKLAAACEARIKRGINGS
jgi:hypothetical protein